MENMCCVCVHALFQCCVQYLVLVLSHTHSHTQNETPFLSLFYRCQRFHNFPSPCNAS